MFKKGESGNPTGRPKGATNKVKLPDLMEKIAEVFSKENKDGVTVLDALLNKLVKMALDGNMSAMRELLDRGYGKPAQTVENINTGVIPQIIYLPADTGIKPYLNESDVIDPTEPAQG